MNGFSRISEVPSTLERLEIENEGCQELGFRYLDCHVLYSAEDELLILIIGECIFHQQSDKSTSLHDSTKYMLSVCLLKELTAVNEEHCSESVSSFPTFMNSKVLRAADAGRVVKQLLLENMPLFEYEPSE